MCMFNENPYGDIEIQGLSRNKLLALVLRFVTELDLPGSSGHQQGLQKGHELKKLGFAC